MSHRRQKIQGKDNIVGRTCQGPTYTIYPQRPAGRVVSTSTSRDKWVVSSTTHLVALATLKWGFTALIPHRNCPGLVGYAVVTGHLQTPATLPRGLDPLWSYAKPPRKAGTVLCSWKSIRGLMIHEDSAPRLHGLKSLSPCVMDILVNL